SIQKQTMQNWRLLVRDDGSTDNTIDILESFALTDKRILFLKDNKGNLGVVRSFEQLLYYSTANYIMFVDQDDVWLPNKIEHTLQ
ncbi:glycosyltransferase, partial [Escherichia coli]|nr:glycosyltransferase [Escherichia coli]